MFKKLYLAFGLMVVLGYGWAGWTGREFFGAGARQQLPPDARQNGYRSFHFWHYGLRGGK
jgi:hypothetical protein